MTMRKSILVWVACFLFLTLLPPPAAVRAQEQPASTAPGQAEKQFQKIPVPGFPQGSFVPGQGKLQAPEGAASVRFRLTGIRFEGATVFKKPQLEALSSKYLNREISLAELYALANEVTAMYRNAGYVLSQALVPAQQIGSDRVATIRVVEGFISKVTVTGVDPVVKREIAGYVDKILASKPLTEAVLERYLLLVNDLTGIQARAVLSPSPTVQGAAELRVAAAQDKVSGYAGITNRGSKFQGPWQGTGQVEASDAFEGYGSLRLFGVTTGNDELEHVTLSRKQFIGYEGAMVSGTFSHTSTRPGGFLSPFDIKTQSDNFDLLGSYPFIRNRARNLTAHAQLSIYGGSSERLDVAQGGSGALATSETEDRIRSLRLGLSYDWVDRYRGVNLVTAELSRGLDILGATASPSPARSRPEGEGRYTKLTIYAARLQEISGPWSVLGSVFGQHADDPLLSPEECGVGGPNYVRGYDQSEIVGDSCLMGLLELRYTGQSTLPWLDSYVGYLFVDGGKVRRKAAAAGESASDERKSLGGGVRFRIERRVSGYMELAVPLDQPVAATMSDSPRLFLAVTTEF
ncbi:MAG: ShlB/FhaC/HecB family hemolysin secretion/activation protein [Arenicellales bacterium]